MPKYIHRCVGVPSRNMSKSCQSSLSGNRNTFVTPNLYIFIILTITRSQPSIACSRTKKTVKTSVFQSPTRRLNNNLTKPLIIQRHRFLPPITGGKQVSRQSSIQSFTPQEASRNGVKALTPVAHVCRCVVNLILMGKKVPYRPWSGIWVCN